MSFAADIRQHAVNVNKSLDKVVTAVLFKANELIIKRTPVDTGRARGGWIATLGTPSTSSPVSVSGDPLTKADKVANRAVGKVYYLANSVVYIGVLEYGGFPNPSKTGHMTKGGFSRKAPAGMLRVSLSEIKSEIAKQVKLNKV